VRRRFEDLEYWAEADSWTDAEEWAEPGPAQVL
jgi:hypothetical protein